MSEQKPKRWLAAIAAGSLLAVGIAMLAIGVIRLAAAPINLLLVLWLLLPLLGLPLALWSAYHLYGLVTAIYRIDRDGFSMRWGFALETAPLQSVRAAKLVRSGEIEPPSGVQIPGLVLGKVAGSDGDMEYFAVKAAELVRLELPTADLIISPSDPTAFIEAFVSATRLGSLDPMVARSSRSNLLTARLWDDRLARWLLIIGLLLPLALIGYLGVQSGQLPSEIPFGFEANGAPGALAPPGRLLLLTLMNGLIWMVNLLIGAWFYLERSQRPMAYGLWGLSLLIGMLFWGAVVQMLGVTL